jgi:hypothetical protein
MRFNFRHDFYYFAAVLCIGHCISCLAYTGYIRLRWLRHVERKSKEITVTKVFKNNPEGKMSVGKPRKRWLDYVENELKKMSVECWKKIAKGSDTWKLFLKETKVLHGL